MEGVSLLTLYNAVLELNIGISKDDLKTHAIDRFIEARARLQRQELSLFRVISNHVVSKFEIENYRDEICILANLTPGPIILYVNDMVGYGLFAEKDYDSKEMVAVYGGIASNNLSGAYVIGIPKLDGAKPYDLDGYFGFKLSEKGRFINEDHSKTLFKNNNTIHKHLQNKANVALVRERENVFFRTVQDPSRSVFKGNEFLWYYGKDYSRPYLSLECAVCKAQVVYVCGGCMNIMYCNNQCAERDWTRHVSECRFIS